MKLTWTILLVAIILFAGLLKSWSGMLFWNLRATQQPTCSDEDYPNQESLVFDHVTYVLPKTLKPKSVEFKLQIKPSATLKDAHRDYYRYIININIECRYRARMGRMTDGGWDICLAGPYEIAASCIVYSFGISQDWSFDDTVSREFGCQVRAFDPYINLEEHHRSELIHFFPIGLSAESRTLPQNGKVIKMETLSGLIRQLSDSENTIDFLKIDVEESEWDILPQMIEERSLKNVKQLALELHTTSDTTVDMYRRHLDTLNRLEEQGFKKWTYHLNPRCTYYLPDINRYFSHCQEVYYINLNFLARH